jgi:hypothetical protein
LVAGLLGQPQRYFWPEILIAKYPSSLARQILTNQTLVTHRVESLVVGWMTILNFFSQTYLRLEQA